MTTLSNNLKDPQIWERFIPLARIAEKMMAEGLNKNFVLSLFPLAFRYEGAYELIMMWGAEIDKSIKDEIIADLQEELDEEEGSKLFFPENWQRESTCTLIISKR